MNNLRYLPAEVIGLRSGGDRCGSAWCAGCGAGAVGGWGDGAGDVGLSRLPSAFTGASPAFCWARRSCFRNFARRFWNHTWKCERLIINDLNCYSMMGTGLSQNVNLSAWSPSLDKTNNKPNIQTYKPQYELMTDTNPSSARIEASMFAGLSDISR